MVYKSRHELVVYFEGHLYKKYHAVFGRSLEPGTKEWAGDRRTPEGVYRIIRKSPDRRWRYFLTINYPNNYDRMMYHSMLADGDVPHLRGRAIPEGGAIGIHGTDEPMLNDGGINWTTGCISVNNGAIDELDALLPVGTLVIIKP
jgi:murein L,D-transpeptidase YafK